MKRFEVGESSKSKRHRHSSSMNILDLPQDLLTTILLIVSQNELGDIVMVKATYKCFRAIVKDHVFLRSIDCYLMSPPWNFFHELDRFTVYCFENNNPSTIFMRGMSEFFQKSDLDRGLSTLRDAALKGYEVTIYSYAIFRRIMTPGDPFDRKLNSPSRDFVIGVRRRLVKAIIPYTWSYELPPLFLERVAQIDGRKLYNCKCAPQNNWEYDWNEEFKGGERGSMCDSCFWIIQMYWFRKEFRDKIDWF